MAEHVRFMFHKFLNLRSHVQFLSAIKKYEGLLNYRSFSSVIPEGEEKDIEVLFLHPRVQSILKTITRCRMEKVFSPIQQEISTPKYQFVTNEELEKLLNDARLRAEEKLQMPPVMKPTKFKPEILSKDYELQGLSTCKYVFTDITYGIDERRRLIVTRHPDGTLCGASFDERRRMNQIYFPVPGRKLRIPKMFEDENLENVLEKREYEFILDRACIQFDPDDPEYIRVTHRTYDHIEKTRSFDSLRSTRHFGPLTFYLTFTKCCDTLIADMIQRELVSDAALIVNLYHIIHPDSKSAQVQLPDDKEITLLKAFAKMDSRKQSHLELLLQTYEELQTKYEEDTTQV